MKNFPDEEFESLMNIVRIKLSQRYGGIDELEDGIQEAYIQAWKCVENGETDFQYILNRALSWGRSFLTDTYGRQPFGHIPRERSGIRKAKGNAVREKIQKAIEEYSSVHGTKPNNSEIARMTGVERKAVVRHMKILKENPVDMCNYRTIQTSEGEKQRLDVNVSPFHYPSSNSTSDSEKTFRTYIDSLTSEESFEEDLLERDSYSRLLSKLEWKHRVALYLTYDQGYSGRELGEFFGKSGDYGRTYAARTLQVARKRLKEAIEERDSHEV